MTRFDHRLHPLSVPFGLLTQLRQFALPALAFLVTAGSTGFGWEVWLLIPLVLSSVFALVKYLTFRYRYEADHIVIRDGLFFRNERHIPYARIQNIDAVQTVLHRLVDVAEVRIDTGGGREPEAKLDVLPLAALAEMRERVFGAAPAAAHSEPAARRERPLLALSVKDLVIVGFIHNRGMIVVGALFGGLWELGVMDRLLDNVVGSNVTGRGLIRSLVRSAVGSGQITLQQAVLAIFAVAGFLVLVRLFSIGWAIIRLYGFTLTREGHDLRLACGLLTHITATVPLRRIQTVAIRETLLHRLFDRVSVRVETAGGQEQGAEPPPQRDWLAPVIMRDELPALLAHILPGVQLDRLEWQPPAPRAFRRELFGWLVVATVAALVTARFLGLWSLLLWLVIVGWGAIVARKYVAHLRWAAGDGVVVMKSGWLSRQISAAPFVKIQVVSLHETPLDRRHAMASVNVDTAGASDTWQRVAIPYLARDTAVQLRLRLAAEAERTEFEW